MHAVQYVLLPPASVGKDKTLQLGDNCQCLDVCFQFLAFTSL